MNREQAYAVLGLGRDASQDDIRAAYENKKTEMGKRIETAPTEALKAKFSQLLEQLEPARDLLLSGAPLQPSSSPSLSATKMADLPNSGSMREGAAGHLLLTSGQVLAKRYEIQEQIGSGGMGAVYRAHDRNTGQEIALKVLLPALTANERARARFLDEARISQKLSHPNIVNVYDVQQDGDLYFITMELLEGQGLRDWLDNLALSRQLVPVAESRRIVSELCDALQYAHQYTVHRDIKPENIWLDGQGRAKLMDFGIARMQSTSQRTQTGAAMGTAYYMAPEQLQGRSDVDGRADLYALGVLLYEMLTGQVPAGRIEPAIKLRKDVGKPLSSLIDQLLSADPTQRPKDAAAVKARVQQAKGAGFAMPELPWKGLSVAAALLIAIGAVVMVLSSGQYNLNVASLLPMSTEEKAQRNARVAKVQGEVKVLKQRLENGRRKLDSDVREAQREDAAELSALQQWQRLTEDAIFNGNRIGELEGELAMSEALLREGAADQANDAATRARDGYQQLWEEFVAAQELFGAEQTITALEKRWEALTRQYDVHAAEQIEAANSSVEQALLEQLAGEFRRALAKWREAESNWQAAFDATVAQIARIEDEREAQRQTAEARRRAELAARAEQERLAQEREKLARQKAAAEQRARDEQKRLAVLPIRQVLDAHVAAIGGAEAINNVRTLKVRYKSENPELNAESVSTSAWTRSGKWKSILTTELKEYNQKSSVYVLRDGERCWSKTSQTEVRECQAPGIGKVEEGISDLLWITDTDLLKVRLTERITEPSGNSYDVLEVPTEQGDVDLITRYFVDTVSRLLYKAESVYGAPTNQTYTMYYEDYRKVGGVFFSHRKRMTDASGQAVGNPQITTRIELNTPIPDHIFTPAYIETPFM